MNRPRNLEISETAYQWCFRAVSFLYNRLDVNITLHDVGDRIEHGQIFLFNHFARFEAVIPQYLIYRETGAYCRSVAAREFFTGNGGPAKLLRAVGAVPNDLPGLLPFLAAEILRGRKVVVFPEGGMVKDRRVLDDDGRFSIFSSTAAARRKHHKGATAVAIMLALFKRRILSVHEAGETPRLERWVRALGLDSVDDLLAAARQPTLVVPSNITFYPIRADDNALLKGVELFSRDLGARAREELRIEGNILLKPTDMSIRFGEPIAPTLAWHWWERAFLDRAFARIDSLDDLFGLKRDADRWIERMVSTVLARKTRLLRDRCMREMYARVTVNLSHIAARLIVALHERGRDEIDRATFHRALYLAIKTVQRAPGLHLHPSLADPEVYDGVYHGACPGWRRFVERAIESELIEATAERYRFLPKLWSERGFDTVRIENMIAVYANEAAPLKPVDDAIDETLKAAPAFDRAALSRLLFDDELRAHRLCRVRFDQARHADINLLETATESGAPYLLEPPNLSKPRDDHGPASDLGVVLVHGFLASPAELRSLGETLAERGHPVIGPRLAGHGTSPWDLRERDRREWLASVRRGFEIMAGLARRVCVVGFSTGGLLALRLAAEHPDGLAGVVSVAAPIRFRNRNLIFVPMIHGANKLTRWVSSLEGVMPFRVNSSEHPEINYRHVPIHGLFELRRLVAETGRRLGEVTCPVAVIQGSDDRIVDPRSATMIVNKLGSAEKALTLVKSDRHGIVTEDIGETRATILSFLAALAENRPTVTAPAAPTPAVESVDAHALP